METSAAPASPLEIGAAAPDFIARSTQGRLQLSDYAGRWVLLFAHPADFTPVCTSELIALQRALPQFEAAGCALIGLSVDSLPAHLAWAQDIEARFGVRLTFPLVEDISMAVARAYGMIHAASNSTATVRASFIIDPQRTIRAILHYPAEVGRSAAELLRLLLALQAADAAGAAAPEGWRPGERLLAAPVETLQEARARGPDWYLRPAGEAR